MDYEPLKPDKLTAVSVSLCTPQFLAQLEIEIIWS